MAGKIGFILSMLAALLNYGTILFWLSIAAAVIILVFGYAISYIVARPHIKEFRETVYQMERDGVPNEEIEKFMDDHSDEDSEFDYKLTPIWMTVINTSAIFSGLVLFIVEGCEQCQFKTPINKSARNLY